MKKIIPFQDERIKIPLLLIALIFAISSLHADSLSSTILSQGPAGYWRFDESSGTTAFDSSGNNYNGSYIGSSGYTLGTPGVVPDDTAMGVNGTNGYMQVGNFSITPSFTVLVWGKSATTTWNTYGWLASARYPNGFIIHPDAGAQTVGIYIIDDTSGNAYTLIAEINVSNITVWHQYGIAYNASTQTASVVFDGQIIGNYTYTGVRTSGAITINFGLDVGTRYGNGAVDEASIFDKALTAGQILQDYQAVVPEPISLVLLLCGICTLFIIRRR